MAKFSVEHDPQELAEKLAGKAPGRKRVLGLDLDTNTGYSFIDIAPRQPGNESPIYVGQLSLALGTYDSHPLRYLRLRQFLSVISPDVIGFERVRYTPPAQVGGKVNAAVILGRATPAIEFLGALMAQVGIWATEHDVPAEGFEIGDIKKFATGKGNANKVDMITAANERYGAGLPVEDYEKLGSDNVADAIFVMALLRANYPTLG